MSDDLIDEVSGCHVGFLHVLLGEELWDNEDMYWLFEGSYRQLCFRTSEYMWQLSHLVWEESEIQRCLWYWAHIRLFNLSRVLNTGDLSHLEGLREESNVSDFRRSLDYLISITPPPPRYLPDPFLCSDNWSIFQTHLPMLRQVYRELNGYNNLR